ncbi:MAG: Flp family type IVb pilin [Vampirovibrionia bacterium]
MQNRGQNLIEFLIIIAVVVLGGILALTLLGGNINEMFNKTTGHVSNYDPFNSKGSVLSPTTKNINGADVEFKIDGSATVKYNDQEINISKDSLDNLNAVFQTTGADGLTTEIVKAIQQMIDDNKAAYDPADVPLEMIFGSSERINTAESTSYSGDASVNQVVLKVGNDTKIIVQDHTDGDNASLRGTYIIDGTLESSKFTNETMSFIDSSGTSYTLEKPEDSKTNVTTTGSDVSIDYNNVKIYQASDVITTVPDADKNLYDWNISFSLP